MASPWRRCPPSGRPARSIPLRRCSRMHDEPDAELELGTGERRLAERLVNEPPGPRAGFPGALGRYLSPRDLGFGPRPPQLVLMVVAYLLAGLLLIGVGALIA